MKSILPSRYFCIKVLYVLIWSLALLYASFPDLFSEKGFDWSFQQNLTNETRTHYIFPYILAMALFLIDAIYVFTLENFRGKQHGYIGVLIGVVLFMFCFLMSLGHGGCLFFLIGWGALTLIKWIKTDCAECERVMPTVTKVAE